MPETGEANIEFAHELSHGHDHAGPHLTRERWHTIVEVLEVILLAIVAVATAYSGFQAAKWDAEEAHRYGESSTLYTQAATERTDGGRFDDLLAKAVAHYAASASGLKVPPRSVALSAESDIESWAPSYASKVNSEMLEWIAGQMRGKRQNNRRLMAMVATFLGATALPLAGQLPNVFDIGM